jgi:hypothetical protein
MIIIITIFFIIGGVYSALGIWFPSLRMHWGGGLGGRPKKGEHVMVCGPVSCAGFTLFFLNLGLAFLCKDVIPKPYVIGLVVCGLCGFILIAVGAALDARVHSRSSFRLPHEPKVKISAEQLGWLFATIGVFFLVVIGWLLVFHK